MQTLACILYIIVCELLNDGNVLLAMLAIAESRSPIGLTGEVVMGDAPIAWGAMAGMSTSPNPSKASREWEENNELNSNPK